MQIKDRQCRSKWGGTDYEMVLYCVQNQSSAKSNLDRRPKDLISQNCIDGWGNNFQMIEYCANNRQNAKRIIEQSIHRQK